MGIMDSISNFFSGTSSHSSSVESLDSIAKNLEQSLSYRRLALEIVIDMVGNSVARVDWKEKRKNKTQDSSVTYLLNTRPNPVESSTEFIKHMVKRLLLDGEVLIYVEGNSNFYVAESYSMIQKSRGERVFNSVMIEGDTNTIETVTQDQSIFFKYNQDNIRMFMNAYMADYEKLIKSSVSSYRTNKTRRFVIDSQMFGSATSEHQKKLNDLMVSTLADFTSSDATAKVYAKGKSWDIENMSDTQIESAKDSRDLIKDTFDIVAQTYHVPSQMIMSNTQGSNVTQNVIDNYLLGIVFPIVDLFTESINHWNYSKDELIKGTKIHADVSRVRLTDLKTIGTFIAQVFPTGAISLNDVAEKYLQLDTLPEDISDIRVITKNYAKITDFEAGTGGEYDEDVAESERVKQNGFEEPEDKDKDDDEQEEQNK